MTRRERLEAKLEKRNEWAEKAQGRAEQRFATVTKISDGIPLGQPILVGHHSERHARRDVERIHNNMSKGVEESKLAQHHASCASGIENALENSIFSDDPDAVEALEAKIAKAEAVQAKMKAANAAIRFRPTLNVRNQGVFKLALGIDKNRTQSYIGGVEGGQENELVTTGT